MEYNMTIDDVLSKIEKLHALTERKSKEIKSTRFIVLNELARKIRVSLVALHYIPYEQYEVLCAPTNLLYHSMITDLMTSLLISQVTDTELDDIIRYFDIDFVKSLKSALKANIEIRKMTYPDDADAFEEQAHDYQEKLYDDVKDCLNSAKGEEWDIKSNKHPIKINGVSFNGQISQIYKILKSSKEVSGYAYIYQYYRLFSQSEHFSMKGRIMNHKNYFHEGYYNKVRCIIYLGAELLLNKYKEK